MALNSKPINDSPLEVDNISIFKNRSQLTSESKDVILDRDWSKHSFLLSDDDLNSNFDVNNRYWSSASLKFTDTTLGGNIGINPKPQFTRYSDIRDSGRKASRNKVTIGSTTGNYGMGRYYSEAIDDPAQTIYLRFGVPEFNSLSNFLSKFVDPEMSALARTGRAPSVFYNLAKAVGTVTALFVYPQIAAPILAGRFIASFFIRPSSKFYTLKPTMHLYWGSVNNLVNALAVNEGIFPKVINSEKEQRLGKPFKLDQNYLDQISNLMPDVFRGNNYFDLYTIANRAQRLANQLDSEDFEKLDKGTATDYNGYLNKNISGDGSHITKISDKTGNPTLVARLNELTKLADYSLQSPEDQAKKLEISNRLDKDGNPIKEIGFFQELARNLDSEFRDGSQFAIFKVDFTGSVSESFGNSTAESDLSSKLNSQSSTSRQIRFSAANGNLFNTPEVLNSVVSAAGDVVKGTISGLTLGYSNIFEALAGNSYVDIPKYWQSSTANLPRQSYSFKLISPYNNAISRMMAIHIPLSMILAGTLPLSTGKQSYTSPYLCQLFDRGRQQIKLGIIESLSITRGTSNLAFDIEGKALAIDVTFTVADLSTIMHMPVTGGSLTDIDMSIDEDNILSDYLAVLAGQGIYDQMYNIPKAKIKLAKKIMNAQKLTSPGYWSSVISDTIKPINVIEGLSRGTILP